MIKVEKKSISWPVKARLPKDGEYVEHEFRLSYRALGERDYESLLKEHPLPDVTAETKLTEIATAQVDYLIEIIDGWADIEGPDGKPLPFTPENFKRIFLYDPNAMRFRGAAFRGLQEIRFGEKN